MYGVFSPPLVAFGVESLRALRLCTVLSRNTAMIRRDSACEPWIEFDAPGNVADPSFLGMTQY